MDSDRQKTGLMGKLDPDCVPRWSGSSTVDGRVCSVSRCTVIPHSVLKTPPENRSKVQPRNVFSVGEALRPYVPDTSDRRMVLPLGEDGYGVSGKYRPRRNSKEGHSVRL